MALDGEGGSGCRELAGVRCSGPMVAYNIEDLAQKNREGLEVLTEAWSGRGVTQVASATRSGGGRGRSSRMNRRRESPGLRERRGGPRGHCKGVEGFRAARAPAAARNFGSGGVHLRRMLGEIPALAWLNSWDRKLGEILGAEA